MFIEAKDDGGGGDNWTTGAISRAKLQSNHHHQQTNKHRLTPGSPGKWPLKRRESERAVLHLRAQGLGERDHHYHANVIKLSLQPKISFENTKNSHNKATQPQIMSSQDRDLVKSYVFLFVYLFTYYATRAAQYYKTQ